MTVPINSSPIVRPRHRGVALVLVLSFLVIISGLIIAFFTNVTSEATSANLASASTTAKTLSDSAVNIVMSQISDATSGKDPATGTVRGPANAFAWASQPGMIRTYDNKGTPSFFYKLYSSDTMKFAGKPNLGSNDVTGDVSSLPTDWNSSINSDVYVDLNAPLADSLNYLHYPIADPRADATYSDPNAGNNDSKDPDSSNYVDGFQVARTGVVATSVFNPNANQLPMPVKWLYLLEDGTLCAPEVSKSGTISIPKATSTNRIKGRVAFWTDDESSKVNINTASEGNYWDTPRIFSLEDVGTANLAAYNSIKPPIAGDPGLALCQPASKEYQRYAGHPAKTSLSVIFGGTNVLPWKGTLDPTKSTNISGDSSTSFLKLDRYYDLVPRLAPGGSHSGTVAAAGAVILDNDRLFSSIDELMFRNAFATGNGNSGTGSPYRSVNATVDPGSTPPPSAGSTPAPPSSGPAIPGALFGIRKNMLDKTRFFITANSNAPEVNQYNLPRISMWPINDTNFTTNTPKADYKAPHNLVLSPFDQLAAFCTSIGAKTGSGTENPRHEYYFSRWNPRSTVDDLNIILGGTRRNVTIYKYLRSLTSLPVPGHVGPGDTFLGKYPGKPGGPTDRDQILTEVLDYVRCVNLGDTTVDPTIPNAPSTTVSTAKRTQYTPVSTLISLSAQTAYLVPGGGEVLPLRINPETSPDSPALPGYVAASTTQGFGRIDTMANAYLIFYGVRNEDNKEPNSMGVVFAMSTFCPAQGNKGYTPNITYRVKGLAGLYAATMDKPDAFKSLNLPDNGIVNTAILGAFTWHGRGIGGTESPCLLFSNGLFKYTSATDPSYLSPNNRKLGNWDGSRKPDDYYPFYSKTYVKFDPTADKGSGFFRLTSRGSPNMNPTTKEITVQIFNNVVKNDPVVVDTARNPIQTLKFVIPDGTFRIPRIVSSEYGGSKSKVADADDSASLDLTKPATNAFNTYRLPYSCGDTNTDGFITDADTVVGLEPAGVQGNAPTTDLDPTVGDYRMYAALPDVSSSYFRTNRYYSTCDKLDGPNSSTVYLTANSGSKAYSMMRATGQPTNNGYPQSGLYIGSQSGKLVEMTVPSDGRFPDVPSRVGEPTKGPAKGSQSVTRADGKPGDWDTGIGLHKDGAYINKPDEGDQGYSRFDGATTRYRIPYIEKEDYFASAKTDLFSPNRQVSSPIMFGSLPTGVKAFQPWQTLLFHPMPEDTGKTHPGYQKVPDHYIADLFWMPVVDPYAVSQPFSTAGKLNMNAEIQPFTYITRSTALRAAMKATKLMAISTADYANYKPAFGEDRLAKGNLPPLAANRRYRLNLDETLREFYDKKFGNGDLFRSASQICEVNLIPTGGAANGTTLDTIGAFWAAHTLTGDNLREAPYTDLYPRLTTKSNTFTVHVYAQALKKSSNTKANEWVHGKDQVVAEYRGSSIIERYIDSNDPKLPDFANLASKLDTLNEAQKTTLNIDQYYKFRVISTRRFSP